MLAALCAASAYAPPLSAVTTVRRGVSPSMQVTKKVNTFEGFDGSVLFEVRETSYKRPAVKILSRLNELKVSTAVAEAVRCCTRPVHTPAGIRSPKEYQITQNAGAVLMWDGMGWAWDGHGHARAERLPEVAGSRCL